MAAFCLLHGDWHDGSCWDPLVAELRARGHEGVAPDMPYGDPEAGFEQRIQPALRALEGVSAPLVVVGHSVSSGYAALVAAARPAGQLPVGPKGDKGAQGPSDLYNRNDTKGIAIRGLPVGSYELFAKIGLSTTGPGQASLACSLVAAPVGGGSTITLDHAAASGMTSTGTTELTVPLQGVHGFSTPQNIGLDCSSGGNVGTTASVQQMNAIKVGAIH